MVIQDFDKYVSIVKPNKLLAWDTEMGRRNGSEERILMLQNAEKVF